MVDRTALLLPRLRLSQKTCSGVLDDTIRQLRIGHAVAQLRKAVRPADREVSPDIRALLSIIAAQFGGKSDAEYAGAAPLVAHIDALMARIAGTGIEDRSRLLDPLVDLRFALGPASTVGKSLP